MCQNSDAASSVYDCSDLRNRWKLRQTGIDQMFVGEMERKRIAHATDTAVAGERLSKMQSSNRFGFFRFDLGSTETTAHICRQSRQQHIESLETKRSDTRQQFH